MGQEYFIYNERENKTQQVSKEQYNATHSVNYMNPQNSSEEKKQATVDYFEGIRSGTKVALPKNLEMFGQAGNSYKNLLSDEARALNYFDAGTEIGQKRANAEKILASRNSFREKTDKYIQKRLGGNVYNNRSLDGIAAFLTGKDKADTELVEAYLQREMGATEILTRCIQMFVSFPLDKLDISSDSDFASNSALLEKLSAEHDAVVNLVAENRTTYEKLPQKIREDFEAKIGETNGLVNYYRLMSELLTNPYYVTHENRELSRKSRESDTKEQKHLFRLLTQSQAGLMALKNLNARELDSELNKMIGTLNRTVVKKEQIELQRKLEEREELVNKMGFSQYLNHLEQEGNLDGMNKGAAKGAFDRAKFSINRLELPEQVENGTGSVIGILNQLEFVNDLSKQKKEYQNTFYLENNYRAIYVMEEVEKLSGPLTRMKDAILSMANITKEGDLATKKISKKEQDEHQKIYSDALAEYQEVIGRVIEIRKGGYLKLSEDSERSKALYLHYANKHIPDEDAKRLSKTTKEEEEALRERIKDLYLTLSEYEYSDISIYRNAPEILELFAKSKGFLKAAEYNRLNSIAELAFEITLTKRKRDVKNALKQGERIPAEDLKILNEEDRKLGLISPKDDKEKTARKSAVESYRNTQFILRTEAQKLKFDSADRKAVAAHYMHQDQWAENSRKGKKGNLFKKFLRSAASGITRFVSWAFSSTRSNNHGEKLYDRSKTNLMNLPVELNDFGEKKAKQSISYGDGKYAPKVELNKYFKDDMKMELAGDYNSIRALVKDDVNYPQCINDAVEALGLYSQVRGIVNGETFEMEQAFLDRFRKSVETMIGMPDVTSHHSELAKRIMSAYNHLEANCHGTLAASMSREELEAAKEMTAVYTTKTYKGDNEDSNVRDLPLFPHSPQLNDIKQGVLGNCYMLSAVQAVVAKNPKAIQDMFYDLGDGNVIVRFFASYGVVDAVDGQGGQYVRIDDTETNVERTIRPVYVKVRKHYTTGEEGSANCLWMQLLEKAYAAAGFNEGHPEIDEKGELHNLNDELTSGDTDEVMVHLTGQMYYLRDKDSMIGRDAKPQSVYAADPVSSNIQRRMLFKDVPEQLHNAIYKELVKEYADAADYAENGEWTQKHVEAAVERALTNIYGTIDEILEKLDILVSEKKITQNERDDLRDTLHVTYNNSEGYKSDYVRRILDNISDPQAGDLDQVESIGDIEDVKSRIENVINNNNVSYDALFGAISSQRVLYEEINNEDVSKEETDRLAFSLGNIIVPNPGEYYKQEEIGYLRLIRGMLLEGKAVPLASKGHALTALDIKLHNNRWFVLIRDPFNSYRNEYTQKDDGEVEKEEYGFFSAVSKHRDFRKLSSDMKDGFLGTSWWELKDVFKSFDNFVLDH